MTRDQHQFDRVQDLCGAVRDGEATEDVVAQLETLLAEDADSRQYYVDFMFMHALMERYSQIAENGECVPLSPSPIRRQSSPHFAFHSPATLHRAVGYFSSGWPVAYLVATVICGVGLLISAYVHVSQPVQMAVQSPPATQNRLAPEPTMDFVGRITGMVDCQWETKGLGIRDWRLEKGSKSRDPKSSAYQSLIPNPQSLVSLGDKFALSSGLMEITYETGAKVILQGPVTYEVESRAGGYLSVGKLTAKLEKKNDELRTAKNGIQPIFAVRTPTAVVTDLGTEFGVEVDKQGGTISHVFRGSVQLQTTSSDGKAEGASQVLNENQSARVENRGDHSDARRITMLDASANLADFVREIPKPTIKVFDLADVVAGGDGFSGQRNRGIDPRNGRAIEGETKEHPLLGDGKYHRVDGMPFVDGVFIPYGGGAPVQLDSAGHTFADFPATEKKTAGLVFAGKEGNNGSELGGVDYNSPGHGMIAMHANKGVTFDLDAIRRANPGCKLLRFRGVAGNAEIASEKGLSVYADVWVLVDGQVRFRRREINRYNGPMPAVVPIMDNERFLTLVATDGGNGIGEDHTMFGDPQIEMVADKAAVDLPSPRNTTEQ